MTPGGGGTCEEPIRRQDPQTGLECWEPRVTREGLEISPQETWEATESWLLSELLEPGGTSVGMGCMLRWAGDYIYA